MIYDKLVNSLGKYSQAQYPFEACGIITKDFEFFPSENLSMKPKHSFVIDPVLLVKHDDNIWGIFHSHPDIRYEEPSEEDLLGGEEPDSAAWKRAASHACGARGGGHDPSGGSPPPRP